MLIHSGAVSQVGSILGIPKISFDEIGQKDTVFQSWPFCLLHPLTIQL